VGRAGGKKGARRSEINEAEVTMKGGKEGGGFTGG